MSEVIILRKITQIEALETMAMFHNITPGQLDFVLKEFDEGRGEIIIREIINHDYTLKKLNDSLTPPSF